MTEKREREEEAIDLGNAKDFFFGLFGQKGKKAEEKEEEIEKEVEEEVGIEWKRIWNFLVKYQIVLLILIPMFLAIFFRTYPTSLPITDDWAKNAVYNNIKADIAKQIDIQYPTLLAANKETITQTEYERTIKEQKAQIDQQIKATSDYFKSQMRDEKGTAYLIGIDSYFWMGEANDYVKNGYFGTEIVNGSPMNMLRNGRRGLGIPTESALPLSNVIVYKVLKIFNPNVSMMYACFLVPIILMALSIIPIFFIGRKIAGNMGGFFAATFLAIQPFLVGRLSEPDTDIFQVFFPLMMLWFFVEAVEAKKETNGFIFAALAGILSGLYAIAWKGWWYMFDFIIGALFVYLVYCLIYHIKEAKENGFAAYLKHPDIKNTLLIGLIFIAISCLSVTLFVNFNNFVLSFNGPFSFSMIKEVGITTIWPNVFTTVAEFNEVQTKQIISMMGGTLFFLIAVIGILLTTLKRKYGKFDIKYAVLFIIWFAASTYAFTKGTRFALLLVPAFAISFGVTLGVAYDQLTKFLIKTKVKKDIARLLVILLLCLLLISPLRGAHAAAKNAIPSMNDGWYDSLTEIKNNSTDAIITSWWDFGHWFVTIGERRVTFDGADQGMRIHWVGKTLSTDNETEAVNILRMLNCDQDYAYRKLYDYTNDSHRSVILVYEIISQTKEDARKTLQDKTKLSEEQINDVLKSTHCDNLLDQFYIASGDMVGKAGVWGHFGSWDFERAEMYSTVKGMQQAEGISTLEKDFNLSSNEAFKIYYEIQNQKGDQWITSWPSYYSGLGDCRESNTSIECDLGFNIGNAVINKFSFDLESREALFYTAQKNLHPQSVVYPIKSDKGEEDVYEKKYSGEDVIPISVVLVKKGDSFKYILMDPKLANSMFTRMFFYEGRGLKKFKPFITKQQFSGDMIYIYKVDLQ